MKESSTYQAVLEEGREMGRLEARLEYRAELLLRIGRHRLGYPSETTERRIKSIKDSDRFWRLVDRLLDARDWAELLADEQP